MVMDMVLSKIKQKWVGLEIELSRVLYKKLQKSYKKLKILYS